MRGIMSFSANIAEFHTEKNEIEYYRIVLFRLAAREIERVDFVELQE